MTKSGARRHAKKKATRKAGEKRPQKLGSTPGLPPGVYLSINQWAEETRRDRRTVTKMLSERGVRPAGMRDGFPVYRLRDLLEMDLRGPDGSIDPEKLNPFERAAWYKAERERLAVNAERGLTIERADHEREIARVLKIVAHELEVCVDEVERDIGATPAVLTKLEQKMDAIRERIYNGIVADDDVEDEDGDEDEVEPVSSPEPPTEPTRD